MRLQSVRDQFFLCVFNHIRFFLELQSSMRVMLHNSLGQLFCIASIPPKPCVLTSQRLFETPMVINPEFSFAVCFPELAVRDQKVISKHQLSILLCTCRKNSNGSRACTDAECIVVKQVCQTCKISHNSRQKMKRTRAP